MIDKEKIKKLEKENKELKKKLTEKEKSSDNSFAWDFYWDGKGDYLEVQRHLYGDFLVNTIKKAIQKHNYEDIIEV